MARVRISRRRSGSAPAALASHAPALSKYVSFVVAPRVHLVSYLSSAGYTLTTCMNLETKQLHGFASNDKEWHPLTGTLEP